MSVEHLNQKDYPRIRHLLQSLPVEGIAIQGTSSYRYQKMIEGDSINARRFQSRRSSANHCFALYPDQDFSDPKRTIYSIGRHLFDTLTYALYATERDRMLGIKSSELLVVFVPPQTLKHNTSKDVQHVKIKISIPKSNIIGTIESSGRHSQRAMEELSRIVKEYIKAKASGRRY